MNVQARRELCQAVRALIEPSVARQGCELVAVEFVGAGGKPVLRLSIDRPGGIAVADCANVSRAVSPILDVEDPIPSAYDLEVSSPGIERPVQRLEDFVRFTGFRVRVRMAPGPARRNYVGVLQGLEGDQVLVDVDGETFRLPLERVDRARLDLSLEEFEQLRSAGSAPGDAPTDAAPVAEGGSL